MSIKMYPDPWEWLEARDWDDPAKAHHDIAEQLRSDIEATYSLLKPIRECGDADLAALAQRSHETSTHYKWFLAASPTWRWQVWLHQFKDSAQQRPGYAVTPHDHRYWFTASMLQGSYRNISYDVVGSPRIIKEELVTAPSVYTLSPDTVHSIVEVATGTITVVIRGRGVRPYSTEYLKDGTQVRHSTMRAQLKTIRDTLRSLLTNPSS